MQNSSGQGKVTIIGGGLAGCECALTLADAGIDVALCEMRPLVQTPVHKGSSLAELVCSNSLKATRIDGAAGLLKAELDMLGCHLLRLAHDTSVPAGGALAVDRDAFSAAVERQIASRDNITVVRGEIADIPAEGLVVIAAGPLCSEALAQRVEALVGGNRMAFYDAAAPIVDSASLNMDVLFSQSRYQQDAPGDYLNAPMDREQYELFIHELVGAQRTILHDFERRELFQACQPLEEVARTGLDALRFGAFKPVGICDPRTGRRPWAVVQLRTENALGTAYNLVGFQTNLTFGEQKRVFRMIPGLEQAEFFRYGVMHRNTFVNAPTCLDEWLHVRQEPRVRLAGQITGTEGYVEAMASGLLAAFGVIADLGGHSLKALPPTSALGSLVAYATSPQTTDYQPMHVNFGLVPPLSVKGRLSKRDRYGLYARRALQDTLAWVEAEKEHLPSLRSCTLSSIDGFFTPDTPEEH